MVLLVLKAHRELDRKCHTQAEAPGMEVDNLTVADAASTGHKEASGCVSPAAHPRL